MSNGIGRIPGHCACACCVGGYYTRVMTEVDSKVRAIVLNTNLYSRSNMQTAGMDDPAGQFAWLEGLLQQARLDGEKVPIIAQHLSVSATVSLELLFVGMVAK